MACPNFMRLITMNILMRIRVTVPFFTSISLLIHLMFICSSTEFDIVKAGGFRFSSQHD